MKLPQESLMFSQNLKTVKFSPEVMLALDLRVLHQKFGEGEFYGSKIRSRGV